MNSNYTPEKLREHIILSYLGDNAVLGENYVDWHTDDGKCGLTLKVMGNEFDIIIEESEGNLVTDD